VAAGTLIATFDEDGEVLAWVITPEVDVTQIVHSSDDTDPIRTYAIEVPDPGDKSDIDDSLDLMGQVHAIDAKNRTRHLAAEHMSKSIERI
jgi:hypothetical protein